MILKWILQKEDVGWINLAQEIVLTVRLRKSNKPSVSIKVWVIRDWLNDYQLVKNAFNER